MIVGVLDILTRTHDVGGANLRRLGHRTEQRDFPSGMGPTAAPDVADFAGAIRSEALESRHADISGHIPCRQVDISPREKFEYVNARCVVHGREIKAPPVLLRPGTLSPKGCRVALDQFTKRMARCFEYVVSRG